MYNYKARMYSPTLGRFMQTDPIGYGDGLNWYNYVGSDPVNFVDPTGLNQSDAILVNYNGCGGAPCNAVTTVVGGSIVVSADRPGVTIDPVPVNFSVCPSGGSCYTPRSNGQTVFNEWAAISESLRLASQRATRTTPGSSGKGPQKGLLDYGKDLICALPAISPGLGADLYAGLGGSVGGGLNIDIARGQFGISGSLAVGVGLGAAVGPGVSAGPSGSSVISANLAVGGGFALPVAPGVNVGGTANYNVLGTDPGFSGGSIGRFGTPVGYVNGGANIGFNTPSLYDLGC